MFNNHIQMNKQRDTIKSRFHQLQELLLSQNKQGVIARNLRQMAVFLQQVDITRETSTPNDVYEQLRNTVKIIFTFLEKPNSKQNNTMSKIEEAIKQLLLAISQFCSSFYRVYHPIGCGVMIREFLSSECRLFVEEKIEIEQSQRDETCHGLSPVKQAKIQQEGADKKQWTQKCKYKTQFFSNCIEIIMHNLQSFHQKFSQMRLEVIGQYWRLLYYMDDYLIKHKLETLIKANINALQLLFTNPTKEIMINASKQSLDEIIQYIIKILRFVHDDDSKRRVHMLGAQLGISMIALPSIEKKLVGCKILSKYSYQIFYHNSIYVSQAFYAQWVVQHNFFELIFEDHCQASLIKASQDTFKLLVKRGQISKEKFCKFFLLLEKADSDLRKAMFRLIEPFRVDFYQIQSMLEIFKTIRGLQFYDDEFFYFIEGLSRYSTETQLKNTLTIVQSIIAEHYLKFESYMVRKRSVECYAYVFQRLLTYKQPEDRLSAYIYAVNQFLSEPSENKLIMIKSLFENMTETKIDLYYQQRLSIIIIDELKFIQKSLGLFNLLHRNKSDLMAFIRLALKNYRKQNDTSSLSRQTLREGVNFPQIFEEMLELTKNQQLQDLLKELVGLTSKKQFPFCCIKWVFIRLNRKGLRPIKKQYTDMIATHATIDNPSNFVGVDILQQLIFNSQLESVRRGACQLLTEIYTNFSDDFREEGELYLIQFMKKMIVTIDNKFQQFFAGQTSSTSMMGTLELMEQLMLDTEYFGVQNLRAHNSQVPTSTILLKIYNNITYGDDVLKIFQKKFPSNKTLFEVIVEVAKQFKIGPLDIGLEYPSNLAIKHNGLTLEQLKLNNQQLNAFKLPQSRVKKEPLLIDGQVNPRAKQVFTDMFNRFAPNGKMGKKQCGSYIEAVTLGYCPIYDSRISSLFAEYDADKDQIITLDDFLRFYKESLFDPEKAEAVEKNLGNLRYRRDLKLFDESFDFLNQQVLFRYYIWTNKEIYEHLFKLSHQSDPLLTALSQKLLLRLPTYSKISESLTNEIDFKNKSSFEIQYLLAALQNQLRNNREKSEKFIKASNHEAIFEHLCVLNAKGVRLESDQSCLIICLHILRSLLGIDNLKTISLHQFPPLACSFRKTNVFIDIIRDGVKHGDSNLLEPAFALQLTQSQLPLQWIEESSFSKDKDTRILTCNFLYLWLLKSKDNQINLFNLQIRPFNNEEWFNLLTSITKIDSYRLDLHQIFASKIKMLQKCQESLELDRFNPIIHGNLKIIKEIYATLTIDEKTILNKTLSQLLPKLISNQNRSLVYDLRIIDYSQQLLSDLQAISSHKISKQMQPRNNYVGIRNLGSICYMNSILQQFFTIKQFYSLVMSLKSSTEIKEIKDVQLVDDFLTQLQEMYIYLKCSQKQYYDPTKFCLAIKDPQNNPINVYVQEDAHEFLNTVFGKIEDYVKKQEKLADLQHIFGGKTVTQITCLTCQNKNEVIEHFYHLSVEVNGLKTLKQSFNKLIQPEQITDYFCQNCHKRVQKISKQMLIKESPEILIINLQRIIFDLESFLKVKVHTRFQFEQTLDIHNYFSSSNKPAPYELKGIVIHAGTSEGGHYYSLIKMQGKWYKFNDQTVTIFNESDIGRQAFGGDENTDQWGDLTSSTNAYILFYQKTKEPDEQIHEQHVIDASHPLIESVLQSNKQFAMELKFNQPSFFTALHNLYLKQIASFKEENDTSINRLWSIYFSVLTHLAITASIKLEVLNQIRDDIFTLIQKMPDHRFKLLQEMNQKFDTVKYNLYLHNDAVYRDLYQRILAKALSFTIQSVYKIWKQNMKTSEMLLKNSTYFVPEEHKRETSLLEQLMEKIIGLPADNEFLNNILKSSQFFQLCKSMMNEAPDMIISRFLQSDINQLLEILMGSECTLPGSTKKRQDLPHSQAISLVQLIIKIMQFPIRQQNQIKEKSNSGLQLSHQLTSNDATFLKNSNFYNKMIKDKLDRGLLSPIIKYKSFNNREYSQFITEVLLKAMNSSDQMYDKNIVFNNIKTLLQVDDNLSSERIQWILGIPQLESIKFDGYEFGMMTSSQSQVYSYTSTIFFKDENHKPYLSVLFQKRKYFNSFSVYGIITLLSLLNETKSIREYVLNVPSPCYTHKSYTDWIETYTLRLKHEEHYSLPLDKDILYDQINSLMTAYKEKVKNEVQYDYLPINRRIIGKNYQYMLKDSITSDLYQIQMWSHFTYVLKNRPYGIGNFQLPDEQFSFGSTKTTISKYFLKSSDEQQPSDQAGINKDLTMLTFMIKPLRSISIKFEIPFFKYKIYLVRGKHYSINCPYHEGNIINLVEIKQEEENDDQKDEQQQEKTFVPILNNLDKFAFLQQIQDSKVPTVHQQIQDRQEGRGMRQQHGQQFLMTSQPSVCTKLSVVTRNDLNNFLKGTNIGDKIDPTKFIFSSGPTQYNPYENFPFGPELSHSNFINTGEFEGKSTIPSPFDYQQQISCKVCTLFNSVINSTCEACGSDLRQ